VSDQSVTLAMSGFRGRPSQARDVIDCGRMLEQLHSSLDKNAKGILDRNARLDEWAGHNSQHFHSMSVGQGNLNASLVLSGSIL
jgi:hypothetical protein